MLMDPATALVTGGTGFVGRSLVNRLVAAGHSVRILSRRGNALEFPNVSMYRGDLASPQSLEAAVQGCKMIFHCAAEKTRSDLMRAANVQATRHLLDLARDMRIEYFCHLSSVGVIGSTRLAMVDECTPCNPMNEYETTKLAAEEIVREGLDCGRVVILRPTNIFGPETLRPMLIQSVQSQVRVFLKGNENAHFVYIDDVVAAAMHWIRAPSGMAVDTFIVSSDEEPGNTHRGIQAFLASRIRSAPRPFKKSAPLYVPYLARLIRHGKANYGDVIYSSQRIRGAGFRFPFGLAAGLSDALNSVVDSRGIQGDRGSA